MDRSAFRGADRGPRFRQHCARVLIALLVAPPGTPVGAATSFAPRLPVVAAAQAGVSPVEPPAPSCGSPSSCRASLASGRYPVVSTSRKELWPPDHRLVDVGLRVDVGRSCLGRASVGVAVYSDEPDDTTGDGATVRDAQLDPPDLYLRRERQGSADGRVYLIVATATHEGVSSRGCAAVVVPRSQGCRDRERVEEQARRAVRKCRLGRVPPGYHRLVGGTLTGSNRPPVVNAGPDQGVDLGSSAHLGGTATDDGLPSDSLEAAWSMAQGPGDVTFTSPGSEDTDAAFSQAGTYVLRLTASDGELSAFDDVQVVVQSANAAPEVDAGPDLTITLPQRSATLRGSVTDDGRVLPAPVVTWNLLGGPGPVTFEPPSSATTTAAFPGVGVYELRLAADDGQLTSTDSVRVTLLAEPPPTLDVEDAVVNEGDEGLTGAGVPLRLSKPWPAPVTVDFVTEDRTALRPCDYSRRYGSVTFAPGETERSVLVPVVGDRAPEGDEELSVLLGNAEGAVLARGEATVRVLDDDAGPNRPPAPHAGRSPADGAMGVAAPRLSWASSDPDPADTLRHDVYLGTAFSTGGQQWLPACAGGDSPGPRWGAVAGYDETDDRLVVFGGETPEGRANTDVLVLENASGAGGAPEWRRIPVPGGPGPLAWAGGGYDPVGNRLVLFGGCGGSCDAPSGETWVLEGADGTAGGPRWTLLSASGPGPRLGAAAAYDPARDRLFVFGGASGSGEEDLADLWVLDGAARGAQPSWTAIAAAGDSPAPRRDASLAFDAREDRLVLFGGRTGDDAALGDVHVLVPGRPGAAPSWRRLEPTAEGPAARFGAAVAYDPASQRLLVYGGSSGSEAEGLNYVFSDAWILAGTGETDEPAWVPVAGGGTSPSGRFSPVAAFSESARRLVVAGGANNKLALPPADLWLLADAFGQLPLVSAGQAGPDYLASQASSGEVFHWRVVTRDARGDWRGSPAWRFTTNRPPTVDAGADRAVDRAPATVALAGTATDDGLPASSSLAVSWEQLGGPAAVRFDDPASAATSATFDLPGSYVLRLTANDSQASASDEVVVEVRAVNRAPLVDAGPDRVVEDTQGELALQGSVSDDGLPGSPLTTLWTVASGAGAVVFGDAAAVTTTARFASPGRYVLRLAASDGELLSADEATVFVGAANDRPDLAVRLVDTGRLVVDPRSLETSGTVVVRVGNDGAGTAALPFLVTVFEDRDASGLFEPGIDAVLGEQTVTGLEAGGFANVELAAAGSVSFAGNLVYALVDSGFAVPETDEANNYGSSSPGCGEPASSGDWRIGLEWSWTKTTADPVSTLVVSAPIVIDVDGDVVPDVLFVAYGSRRDSIGYAYDGRLRALGGRDGRELWSVTDPALALTGAGRLAAADLDGDGRPEILALAESGKSLLAFEHDGAPKWSSDAILAAGWGGPSIADLDGDGRPEILVGRQVLSHEGRLLWTGAHVGQGGDRGAHSYAVDLDLDGQPEVLVGNTAYRGQGAAAGQVVWRNTSTVGSVAVSDGYTAVGNFDGDAFPEIVLVSQGWVFLLEHDGALKWGPAFLEPVRGNDGAGPPTVADVDGDGQLEVAVAGSRYLAVFETDGSVKWRLPATDSTPNVGVAAFDFDGDGAAELVYGDENDLRVVRGRDGVVLFRDVNGTSTASDSPVVADVDGDGEAEIVSVTDARLDTAVTPGVRVYGESGGRWPAARRIWNQFQYGVTNVDDDGTVPRHETRDLALGHRWAQAGSVREGALVPSCAFPRPDLAASALRVEPLPGEWRLTVRIGNGGARVVGPGVPVSFYDGDPRVRPVRLGTVATLGYLPPGRFEDVVLALPRSSTTRGPVFVSADDAGGLRGRIVESDEENNLYDTGEALLGGSGQPDLAIAGVDASGLAEDWQTLVVSGTAKAIVRNLSGSAADGPFEVAFFEDRDGDGALGDPDAVLGRTTVAELGALASKPVEAALSGSVSFRGSPLHAFVDAARAVPEADESNNVARSGETCQVRPPGPPWSLREKWAWTTASVVSTPAVGDLDGNGVADLVLVTRRGTSLTVDGQLRAVSGRGDRELFAIADRALDLNPSGSPALGDIDGDGRPEIVAVAEQGTQLLAFEANGTLKWRSPVLEAHVGAAAPFLTDLDGDGRAEVLIGRQVLDGDGSLRWTGSGPRVGRSLVTGLHAVAADLDLDGIPEVVVGPSAYKADGTLLWNAGSVDDGVAAVANLDDDPWPEIVVSNDQLWLLEHDGTVAWGPVEPPGSGHTGPVALADFDGDGQVEIGVGRRSQYSVVEGYGHLRWTAATTQSSLGSVNTGGAASAFDFDGDGAAEVLLADTAGLHVLRGLDGRVAAESPVGTCTYAHSYPLVADLDGDDKAEILMGSNACAGSAAAGLRAVGEAGDGWVRARALWNQYEYSVDNTWRANAATGRSAFASADLTASFVRRSEEGEDLRFTVRVGNAGAGPVGPGVPVAFYNGDPRLDYPFLAATATTRPLAPGEHEDVSVVLSSQTSAEAAIVAIADDPGTGVGAVSECDEENNRHESGLWLNLRPAVKAGPDRTTSLPEATVSLEGSVQDDGLPLGGALDVTWLYATGPIDPSIGGPVFADAASPTTTATFPVAGTYTLRLRASDSSLANSDSLTVTVHPANQAPTVSAGPDRVVELPEKTVLLAGSASDDDLPAGSALQVAWSVVSAPGPVVFSDPASASATATLSAAGTHVLRLTATDGALSSSDDVTVELEAENRAPLVDAGLDARVLSLAASLFGSVSDDGKPRDGALSAAWSLVSGPGAASFADPAAPVTVVTFPVPGSYVLRLTATDGALSASDDVDVHANPANEPPLVDAGQAQSVASRRATLRGAVVDDGLPAGSMATVLWSQVSGPAPAALDSPRSAETAVTFEAEGAYVFRLSASDGELSAEDAVSLDVRFVNAAPVVRAGPDQSTTLPASAVALQGSAEDDGLPIGSSVGVRWSVVSGPAAVAFDDELAAATTARFGDPGTYVLRLRATDGTLGSHDDVVVAVLPTAASGLPPVARLTTPAPGARLALPTDVVGTATSDSLASWQIERRLQGDAEWARVASGTAPVSDGVLGRLDPTLLLNGLHEVRLTVTDTAGRIARATAPVVVREQVKVGHFTVSFVDLEVPVAGLPIRVTRTYDSRDKRRGEFGAGWRLELTNVRVQPAATLGLAWYGTVSPGPFGTYCLQATAPPLVTLTLPDGRVQEFEMRLAPSCQPFAPIDTAQVSFAPVGPTLGRLELVGGSGVDVVGSWPGAVQLFGQGYSLFNPAAYRYVSPDGQVFVVDRTAGLKSLTDRAGNVLTMTPLGITSSHPEVAGSALGISFTRDALGRITGVADPEGRSLAYAYDANGDLVSVTDRVGQATTFTYEEDLPHQLRDILDPLGRRPIRNEYFPDGRLKSHTDAFGNVIAYQHDLVGRQEIVTDRTGAQRVLEYDERGNVVRETDPLGRVVARTFDLRNNRLTETAPYDPEDPPDPIPTTSYAHDPSDNLLSTTDPLGNVSSYTYNDKRQVLTTTDAGGGTTTNAYDTKGNLLSTTDALGNTTAYTYDARGSVLTQTTTVNGQSQVTRYAYDSRGNLTQETDALGQETSYAYDRTGNRLTQTATRTTASGVETLVTSHEYDASGRLVKTTDSDGTSTRTVYDALGRQVESHDKLGRKTAYEYDVMGRLVGTRHPGESSETHEYDAEGRRTSSTDRGGRATRYEYDPLGRLRKTIYADGSFTESTYDPAGRLVATRDALGHATTYEYDSSGRRTAVIDVLGQRTSFTYDAAGNQKTVTDARGNVTTHEYDAANRRTKTILPPAEPGAPPTFTETGYDELGRRVSETDQAGRTTRFEYDAVGRLVAVVDALDQRTTYTYDEQGNRTSQTDANGHVTRFEYDRLGRETKRILPAVTDPGGGPASAAVETKTYDAAGNLETRTDFLGRTTTYAYDADTGRLLSRTYPNPGENVSFTYTATGRRRTAVDARGTTTYDYDVRDRLASLTYPDGRSLGYDYDPQGNRTKLTALIAATSLVVNSSYDDLGRLATVTDPAGRVYTHSYDANGNRAGLVHPNGAVAAYGYDALNRLKSLTTTHPASARHIQGYAFTLGPAGNRTRIVESAGLPQQRTLDYSYDSLYRLTGETVTEGLGLAYGKTFTYDPVGNRLSQATTLGPAGSPVPQLQPGTIGYGYDERDRLLTEQLAPNPATVYAWDANGNLTTKDGEATYTWDHENRLKRVEKADGTVVEHAYDADGNRVRTKVTPPTGPSDVTDYLVDTSGPLSHVVAETDGAGTTPGSPGTLKAYYVRGDDLLAVMRPLVAAPAAATPADWQTRYYHADGLGSIRRLSDEAANITDGYTYTAFGELLAHTGTDPQPYAFTGEPLDPNSGFQYHRARWLDSRTGRFAGMDPFGGSTPDPSSLHRYFYSNGDPANRLDPSGRESLAVSAQATAMIMTLSAMSLVALQAARTNAAAGVIDATTGAAFDIYESGSYAAQRAMLAAELAITTTQRSVSDLIEEAKAIAGASAGTLRRWIPRPPKIVPIPAAIIPAVARHVAVAQVSHPSVLTRTTSAQARMNRRRATAHLPSAGLGQSWDEYPFASSLQGGFGASVQVVPLLENLIQGGIIGVSYAVQQIVAGDDFLVVVVP